jgi:hypothetical protein
MDKMDMVPTLLGAVAGTRTRDTRVLTTAGFDPRACDWMGDYGRVGDVDSAPPELEDGEASEI